jgi:DNA-binding CsgD family transcriptional regulator
MSGPIYMTPEQDGMLVRLVEHDFTAEQIAAHLGVPVGTVSNRSYKLRLREKVTSSQRAAVLRMFGEGLTVPRTCTTTGLLPLTVTKILREARRIPALALDPEIEAIRQSLGHVAPAPVRVVERSQEFVDTLIAGVAAGETQREIAKRLGVRESMVNRSLHERGLIEKRESRRGTLEHRRAEIEQLIAEGLSDYLISVRMSTDLVTLRRALERMDLRKQGYAA